MPILEPMNDLAHHYQCLIGLREPWRVDSVDLKLSEGKVEVLVSHPLGVRVECPECGAKCTIADHAQPRRWRHLDTMQFATEIVAETPRADCVKCGVKTVRVPWAGKSSRFTLLFEAFAIQVIQACKTIKDAAGLLRVDWKTVDTLMSRAVERGMARRAEEGPERVGIDEKNFGKGQDFVSLMCDLDDPKVLEVVAGRSLEAANLLWATLPPEQRAKIVAVCMDMWPPYLLSAAANVPEADVVHDRFHIAQHLSRAVDTVRRQEHRILAAEGEDALKGSRYLWLRGYENVAKDRQADFEEIRKIAEKTSRAWMIKEMFREFWDYVYEGNARKFFKKWYGWAARCQLQPVVKVAKMIRKHFENIATYFRYRITNAVAEGLNSKIQSIKANARGFRSFESYRVRILFFCGKLNMAPIVL